MRFVQLPQARWKELLADFREFGEDDLPIEGTEIHALLEDEKIIGWFLLEPALHLGPFHVSPEYRGLGAGKALAAHCIELTAGREAYAVVVSAEGEQLCQRFGLTRMQGSLYVKEK